MVLHNAGGPKMCYLLCYLWFLHNGPFLPKKCHFWFLGDVVSFVSLLAGCIWKSSTRAFKRAPVALQPALCVIYGSCIFMVLEKRSWIISLLKMLDPHANHANWETERRVAALATLTKYAQSIFENQDVVDAAVEQLGSFFNKVAFFFPGSCFRCEKELVASWSGCSTVVWNRIAFAFFKPHWGCCRKDIQSPGFVALWLACKP